MNGLSMLIPKAAQGLDHFSKKLQNGDQKNASENDPF